MKQTLVIGAGLAGLTCARMLAQAGQTVTVLEARARVGGRVWSRPLAGTPHIAELGGGWFSHEHTHLRQLLQQAAVAELPSAWPAHWQWHVAGQQHTGAWPAALGGSSITEGLFFLVADARAYAAGHSHNAAGVPLVGISLADYVRRRAVPPATADALLGLWAVSGGADPATGDMGDLLHLVASHGAEGFLSTLAYRAEGGLTAVAEFLATQLGLRLYTNKAVTQLSQDGAGIKATTADGQQWAADAAVVAVPLNVLHTISFQPALPPPTQAAVAQGHCGTAWKLLLRLRGVPLHSIALGHGAGFSLLWAYEQVGDEVLAVGFGWSKEPLPVADTARWQAAVHHFWPTAELCGVDGHDWVYDPYAQGTWLSIPAAAPWLVDAERWQPHGRLYFAGADISPVATGWFEGAVLSGQQAAAAVLQTAAQK